MKAGITIKREAQGKQTHTPVPGGMLQRKCACGGTPGPTGECEECRKKRLQRKTRNAELGFRNDSAVPPIVHDVLHAPGQTLDAATRAFMEPRFGHDFSKVRVHADARAAESASAVNAQAYTVGRDMVFGSRHCGNQTKGGECASAARRRRLGLQTKLKVNEPGISTNGKRTGSPIR